VGRELWDSGIVQWESIMGEWDNSVVSFCFNSWASGKRLKTLSLALTFLIHLSTSAQRLFNVNTGSSQ